MFFTRGILDLYFIIAEQPKKVLTSNEKLVKPPLEYFRYFDIYWAPNPLLLIIKIKPSGGSFVFSKSP